MTPPDATWDIRWLDECDSTNQVALDLARDGAPNGVVIVADHQTAGRGRLGRSWQAPAGASLLVSIVFRPAPSQATMAVGVAAAEACHEVAGVDVQLKWPNDLLLEGRKLGGILAESIVSGSTLDVVVVGLGLNVNWPVERPADIADIAIALSDVTGRHVDRRDLLDAILARISPDRPTLLDDYRSRCATLGREVRVELATETFTGTAVDVDGSGRLLVDVGADQPRIVVAGDVVHLRPAT